MSTDSSSDWTYGDILTIMDHANPHTWIGRLDDTDANGPSAPPNLPAQTIEDTLDEAVTNGNITAAMRQQWLDAAARLRPDSGRRCG